MFAPRRKQVERWWKNTEIVNKNCTTLKRRFTTHCCSLCPSEQIRPKRHVDPKAVKFSVAPLLYRLADQQPVGPRVELKQEPVSPLIVIKNPWVILLTSGLLFDITTALHLVLYRHLAVNVATTVWRWRHLR